MIVRKLRLQRGWSQEQLAQMSGLNIRTIQRIERGQGGGLESWKSLAAVFEVPVADLQGEPSAGQPTATSATEPQPAAKETAMNFGPRYSASSQLDSPINAHLSDDERRAVEYVRDIKGFYTHAITYVLVIAGLFLLNLLSNPGKWWAAYPAFGWGIGLAIHGMTVFESFNLFGPEWEKRQIEKRLGRRL